MKATNWIAILSCVLCACDGAMTDDVTTSPLASGTVVLPTTGWGDTGVTATLGSDGSVSWCCTTWFTPLPMNVGDTIASLSVPVRDNGSANGFATSGNNVIIVLTAQTNTTPTVLGSASSNGSGNPQTLTVSLSSAYTVPDGTTLIVKAVALAGGALPGPATHPSLIGGIQIAAVSPGRSRAIPLFSSNGGMYTEQPSTMMVFPTNNIADYHVPVSDGETIGAITARVRCGTPGAVTMGLFKRNVAGSAPSVSRIGSSASCTGASSSEETLSIPGLSEVVTGGFTHYFLDFLMNNQGPAVLDIAYVNLQ